MTTKTSDTIKTHTVNILDDYRELKEALMAAAEAIRKAAIASRALSRDAALLKDPEVSSAARKIQSAMRRAQKGPTLEVWPELRKIEESARRIQRQG